MNWLRQADGDLIRPQTIWCLGRNYAAHAEELGNPLEARPLVFQKGHNALHPLEGSLALPRERGAVHFETELILLMGGESGGVAVTGLTVGLDLTLRDLQSELKAAGKPWTLAKSFDGAAIVGPFQEFPGKVKNLSFRMLLNGEERQLGETSRMILPLEQIPAYLEEFTCLRAGDLIYTGTPAGVGQLQRGDEVELFLEEKSMGKITFA